MKFNLNDYKNKDRYYDYDSMVWDIEALVRIHKNCNKIHGNGEEILSIKLNYLESKEYKKLKDLEQEYEEELELVKIKYKNKIEKLQSECNHYPSIYKGKKVCLKCNKDLESL